MGTLPFVDSGESSGSDLGNLLKEIVEGDFQRCHIEARKSSNFTGILLLLMIKPIYKEKIMKRILKNAFNA